MLLALGVSPMRAGLAAAGSSRSFSNLKRRIAMLGHRSPSSLARIAGWLIAGAALCAVDSDSSGRAAVVDVAEARLPPHLKPWPWAATAEDAASRRILPALDLRASAERRCPARKGGQSARVRAGQSRSSGRDDVGFVAGRRTLEAHVRRRAGALVPPRRQGRTSSRIPAALDEAEQINRPVATSAPSRARSARSRGRSAPSRERLAPSRARSVRGRAQSAPSRATIGAQQAALAARAAGQRRATPSSARSTPSTSGSRRRWTR